MTDASTRSAGRVRLRAAATRLFQSRFGRRETHESSAALLVPADAEGESNAGEARCVHEPAPDLPSTVLAFFSESANREVRVLAALAPQSVRGRLHRDPDGWTPIDDWATQELLLELAGADFTHVRLGNRGRGAVSFEVELGAVQMRVATAESGH